MLQPKVLTYLKFDKDSELAKSQLCSPAFNTTNLLRILGIIFTGILLYVIILNFNMVQYGIVRFLQWISEMGIIGMFIFGAANVIAAVCLMPLMLFTLAAGFLYGTLLGTLVVSISCLVAALTSFLIARYVARSYVVASTGKTFASLDQSVKEEGFMLVMLIRCSPLHPYAFLNYAFGVTSIPVMDYAAASFFGMLPATIMEVYFGSGLKNIADIMVGKTNEDEQEGSNFFFWFGISLTLISTIWITLWVKKKLAKLSAPSSAPIVTKLRNDTSSLHSIESGDQQYEPVSMTDDEPHIEIQVLSRGSSIDIKDTGSFHSKLEVAEVSIPPINLTSITEAHSPQAIVSPDRLVAHNKAANATPLPTHNASTVFYSALLTELLLQSTD